MVGKSDFNEIPVVSPDLDLDFGLPLRVCQKRLTEWMPVVKHLEKVTKKGSLVIEYFMREKKEDTTRGVQTMDPTKTKMARLQAVSEERTSTDHK